MFSRGFAEALAEGEEVVFDHIGPGARSASGFMKIRFVIVGNHHDPRFRIKPT